MSVKGGTATGVGGDGGKHVREVLAQAAGSRPKELNDPDRDKLICSRCWCWCR